MNIEKLLIRDEGLRLKPYKCPAGFLTIGVGRNLDANGISEQEALSMLRYDIWASSSAAQSIFFDSTLAKLSEARQAVIISMVFQMGSVGFRKFKNTIFLIKQGRFEEAADQMLKSKWAKQTPERAKRHAAMMRNGIWDKYYE